MKKSILECFSMLTTKVVAGWVAALILIGVILYFSSGCESCNKKQKAPDVIAAIQKSSKPLEDSLRKEVSILQDSITSLKRAVQNANVSQQVAKGKGQSTISERAKAKEIHDTLRVATLCDQLEEDFRDYSESVAHQDSLQEQLIDKQNIVINNLNEDLELQKNKFSQAAVAYEDQSKVLAENEKKLQKSDRKLRHARFLNKVLGLAAAVVTGLLLLIR